MYNDDSESCKVFIVFLWLSFDGFFVIFYSSEFFFLFSEGLGLDFFRLLLLVWGLMSFVRRFFIFCIFYFFKSKNLDVVLFG